MENNDNKEKIIENISPETILKLYEQNEKNKKYKSEYQKLHKEKANASTKKYYEKIKNKPEFIEKRRKKQK